MQSDAENSTITDSRYAWARLSVSLLIAVIGNVGMWSIIVIFPAVQAEFGVDRALASIPFTFTMIGFGVGNYFLGRLVDQRGISTVLMGAATIIAVGLAGSTLFHSIWALAVMQLLVGFGGSACFGPLIADISHWFVRRRGMAVAIVASGNYLSGAIWPLMLSGVLVESGWRAVHLSLAVIVLLGICPLALFLRRKLPVSAKNVAAQTARAAAHVAAFSPRTLQWLLAAAGIGCCVAMSMPQVHIVALCTDLGFGPAVGTQMLSLMLVGGVASRLVSGLLGDWLGGVKTLLLGSILQCLALALYLPSSSLPSLFVVSAIFGLSQGGIVPSYALIVREYMPPQEAGARVGFVIMATILGMAIGGWMTGWIYDLTSSYDAAFLNGIAWNIMNILIVLFILWRSSAGLLKRELNPA